MLKNKKGIALITAYIVIAVLTALGAAFISRSISEMRVAERAKNSTQAFYIAEAGIDYAIEEMRNGNTSDQNTATLNDSNATPIGYYNVNWQRIGSSSTWEIISDGFVGDTQRKVTVEALPDTFARYLYFTDDEHFRWWWWRVPVWFVTGDNLGGPLQTNSHFHISGDPAFSDPDYHRPVKSVDDFITYMNGGSPINSTATSNSPNDNPTFEEGLQLDSDRAPFPSRALDLENAASQPEGLALTGATTIVLNSDGTMNVTNNDRGWSNENMSLPDNGAMFVDNGDVTISGTLNGQLSIGTSENIVVSDNVTYNTDPRVNPTSTDTLGLIAERDVVISQSAPHDIEIDASVMALGESFTVENYWQGPPKGTISVYGGIIQDERGPVGTFNPSTNSKASGYSKDYQYDPRLMASPPPFYPTTGDYVISSWSEE